jgi:hypothetical protein
MRHLIAAVLGIAGIAWIALSAGVAGASLFESPTNEVFVYTVDGAADSDIRQSALAHDRGVDRFFVAWTIDSGAGHDLFAGTIGANGFDMPDFIGEVDGRDGALRDPDVSYCILGDAFLCVWSQEEEPGAFEVFGRLVRRDGTFKGPSFQISSAGSNAADARFDALHPSVATDDNGGFLVVWASDDDRNGMGDDDFEVFARRVPSDGSAMAPIQRLTTGAAGGGLDSLRPDVCYRSIDDSYFVIHETDADTGPAYTPLGYVVFVPSSGLLLPAKGATSRPLSSFGGLGRRVEGYGRDFVVSASLYDSSVIVAYQTNGASGQLVSERIEAVVFSPSLEPLSVQNVSDPNGTLGPACRVTDPDVAYSWRAASWVVSWSGERTGTCGPQSEIYAAAVFGDGSMTPGVDPVRISGLDAVGAYADAMSPAVAVGVSGDVLVIWSDDRRLADRYELLGQPMVLDDAATSAPVMPRELVLHAAPNPFNPATRIEFALPMAGPTQLRIYDVRGQLVRRLVEQDFEAGVHTVSWNGTDDRGAHVASGVYHLRLVHAQGTLTRKLTLVE